MVGMMGANWRDGAEIFLNSIKSSDDALSKIEQLRKLKEVVLVREPSLLPEFAPRIVELGNDKLSPGRSSLRSLCKLKMDIPFALRGYLGGTTNSKYQMTDGLHRTRFPSGLSIAPHGSRALHGSRVLSESSSKGAFLNRPLSPHLALKKPQLSATYSISHRIFGAVLAGAIMLPPIAMKFSLLYDV